MALKNIYKNAKVRMLLSGATIVSKIVLMPILGAEAIFALGGLDAGVSLSNELIGAALHDKANEDSSFRRIIDDKQIERAIHRAICAVFLEQSKTHANMYYKAELIKLSEIEFNTWEDFLKYPVYEDEKTDKEKQVLTEIDKDNFNELLYFAGESPDVIPLIDNDEWLLFLTYLEKQTGIELIADVKERAAKALEKDFLTYLKKSVSQDQQLVNLILIEYLPKLLENQQITNSVLRNLPEQVVEYLERKGLVSSADENIRFDLPPLTNFFTGRKKVLENLYKTLREYSFASLHGMFGIGKTTVALKYAYEYQRNYAQVIFIRATETELLQQMANVAESFDKKRVDALEKLEDKAKFLRSYLDNPGNWSEKDKKYLLIFDNVDSVEQIKSFIPSNKQGEIIFTANDRNITGLGPEVEISEIETNDGELLLFRRSNSKPQLSYNDISGKKHPSLEEIVLGLGCSPLAINIAGAYIYSTKTSLEDYLQLIKTKEILEEEDTTDLYHNKTILKAFEISYMATCTPDKKTKDSELIAESAMHLIHGSVFISPNDIPEELLQKYLLRQGDDFQRVVDSNYLWLKARAKAIQFDLLRYDSNREMYWTHRLIQMNIEQLLGL